MFDAWNDFCLWITDPLLGWMLSLPRDLTVFLVALITALLLTLVRPLTTNQRLLGAAANDDRRLKQLLREARRARDKEAAARYRATRARISMIKLKAEGLPLLVSILPVAILATWAVIRLEYLPPKADEPVEVALVTPVGLAGGVAFIVPQEGVSPVDGWVAKIEAIKDEGPPHGMASWKVKAEPRTTPYTLTIRTSKRSVEQPLLVGQPAYATAVVDHGDQYLTQLKMQPARFLGILPGSEVFGEAWQGVFPGWLVAYLVLSIPLVMVLRKVLGVN